MEPEVIQLVKLTDEIRAVARELADYNLDELNPAALRLNEISTRLDRALAEKVANALTEGVRIGRDAAKSEIAAKAKMPKGIVRVMGRKVRK